jgi:hypothetical protein
MSRYFVFVLLSLTAITPSSASAKSMYEDNGSKLIRESICDTRKAYIIDNGYIEESEGFTFLLKVNEQQVFLSEGTFMMFSSNHSSKYRWHPITSAVSKNTFNAIGNWGVYIETLDDKLYFSRIDVHSGYIFSFVANCQDI